VGFVETEDGNENGGFVETEDGNENGDGDSDKGK